MHHIEIGQRFNRWTVIGHPFRICKKSRARHLPYRCDCGLEKPVYVAFLVSGRSRSCRSCGHKKHGGASDGSAERLYRIWKNMNHRCRSDHPSYGGRGIRVCKAWRESFEDFKDWALSSGYSDDLTIERTDVESGYTPDNCKWVPFIEQSNNRRNTVYVTAWSETKTIRDWMADARTHSALSRKAIYHRLTKWNWPPEAILTAPPGTNKNNSFTA